jgi:hypothetical protein
MGYQGKALGVPVFKLLGGKTNKRNKSLCSQLQFDWDLRLQRSFNPKNMPRLLKKLWHRVMIVLKSILVGFDLQGLDGMEQLWDTLGMIS